MIRGCKGLVQSGNETDNRMTLTDEYRHILIAADKFKGSLSSLQVARAIHRGILLACKKDKTLNIRGKDNIVSDKNLNNNSVISFDIVEMADGGDGSARVLRSCMGKEGVQEVKTQAIGPDGREIETSFLLYTETNRSGRKEKCAFIEMAAVSGLELLPLSKRNPLYTTTYGLGQLLLQACRLGAGKIVLSIGGSATNDGGTGMLQALGFKFYNKNRDVIKEKMCGKWLGDISAISYPDNEQSGFLAHPIDNLEKLHPSPFLNRCAVEVICDVTNPLLGSNGATMVYAPQKGATKDELTLLETGMANYVAATVNKTALPEEIPAASGPLSPDVQLVETENPVHTLPGSGAAGGVGYAVKKFLNGKIVRGWDFFATRTNLEEKIKQADLVISGEGKIDSQSLSGKVVDGIVILANKHKKPVWLFCGVNELPQQQSGQLSGCKIFELQSMEPNRARSMKNGEVLLEELACKAWRERAKEIR